MSRKNIMPKQTNPIVSHVETTLPPENRDQLAVLLHNTLNEKNIGKRVAYFLDTKDNPTTVTDWVSTGSTLLDLAISNRPHGGLPVGKIVEINGLEGTGKSLLCAHIIAETQKKGGFAVIIDPEYSAAPEFWTAIGVSIKDLLYVPAESLESMLFSLEKIINESRRHFSDRLITVAVDSIASVPTKKELEGSYDDIGFNTEKSKILSLAMRKLTGLIANQRILTVFTNQLRQNLKAMSYSPEPYVEPGGLAFKYHASVRIRMRNVSKVKNEKDEIIGRTVTAEVIKNKVGPGFRKVSFNILYDSGIQDVASWIDFMKERGLITSSTRAGYSFSFLDGGPIKKDDFIKKINTDKEFKELIYNKICESYIMIYREPNTFIHDELKQVEEEDEFEISKNNVNTSPDKKENNNQ